ncbi:MULTISPECIES: hypothetical protein [unclassified Streptomyces]|uniref:hypothetical protein n=1 Tax=unclassified Streptomyces TaxID=2593676 RepID=UPI000DC32CF3|nr:MULTISPECIES: hypothetical protein [unclassified Streptomyces]RAJ88846.1 hypothetical protein K377_02308 [Streptomyces sp. PsTaAH-137]
MTTNPRPRLEGQPATPVRLHAAPQPVDESGVGARKVVAEGVRTARGVDPHGDDGRRPIAWLTINAPGRGRTPTATSWCACGRDLRARGQADVFALVASHDYHRTACPLRNPQEGRAAA